MNKRVIRSFSVVVFIFVSIFNAAAQPEWVKTFGMSSPYSQNLYLTGFSMIEMSESNYLVKVKELALSDLTAKIETNVASDITLSESEADSVYSSSATIITRCTVNVTVSGVDYEIYRDDDYCYALAWVSVRALSQQYVSGAGKSYREVINTFQNALKYRDDFRSDKALNELYKAKLGIAEVWEQYYQYKAVNQISSSAVFFGKVTEGGSANKLSDKENEVAVLIEELEELECSGFDEAVEKAALIMRRQNVGGGYIDVGPLSYGQTTFSSSFGRAAADRLEAALIKTLEKSSANTVFKGNYHVEGEKIRISVIAIDSAGSKTAQAEVLFPSSAVDSSYDLMPQNFNEAMIAMKEFADGAVVDGGLNVDIWTNKGRDTDALVYEEDETLELYFRVNQPAFLQITYHLATGQMVLLERQFYIGIDKVNRTVKYPDEFVVQRPFGIEQLIVTAYSNTPPRAATIIQMIEGEEYEVFASMPAVTMQTRGLRKKDNNPEENRVGEAILNLTTVPRY